MSKKIFQSSLFGKPYFFVIEPIRRAIEPIRIEKRAYTDRNRAYSGNNASLFGRASICDWFGPLLPPATLYQRVARSRSIHMCWKCSTYAMIYFPYGRRWATLQEIRVMGTTYYTLIPSISKCTSTACMCTSCQMVYLTSNT